MAIPVPEKRIAKFEKLGFGMFIHWGLYSQLGRGEWVQFVEKIPKEEYAKLKDTFTAKEFNGREIAKIAKRAGMNYITLTTRHHEGFSLYDTRGLNDYDAPHSPAGRDLIKDFVEGCRAEGILPMFYHTTLDWYNDDFNGNFKEYLKYLRRSVEILCTEYGEIGGLWFDGNWSKPNDDWEEDELYSLIRRNQPDAMIINNTGLDARGFVGNSYLDSVTFEQGRPTPMNREGMPKYLAAEMCQTIN
ncbi:MAG: alpha-L-fucosidase, partial [Clostridia bacterium]|nr:alpha-L-fucosidase [Clostridia bacterium]